MLGLLGLTVLAQATLLTRIRLLGASPNLLLVVVLTWSLLQGVEEGVVWSFIGGLGIDLISGGALGTSSLALMSICLLASLGTTSVFAGNLLLPIFLVALATPLHGWLILLTHQLRGLHVNWLASTVRVIGPELLLNALLIVLVYPMLRWLAVQIGAEKMKW
jgi:rod shape-determining protein MreD